MTHPTNPSDARERIAAIQDIQHRATETYGHSVHDADGNWCFHCGYRMLDDIKRMLLMLKQLESEACIKDAYAYELVKQRDAAITEASDLREALLQATTPPAFTEEMGSGST